MPEIFRDNRLRDFCSVNNARKAAKGAKNSQTVPSADKFSWLLVPQA